MIIVEKRLTEDEYKQTDSGLYVPDKIEKSPENKTQTEKTIKTAPTPVDSDTQKFELTFRDNFYNKGKRGKKQALEDLAEYLKGENNRIRLEFLSSSYNDVYKENQELANEMLFRFMGDTFNNSSPAMSKILETNYSSNPKHIKNFVDSLTFENLANGENVFLRLANQPEYSGILNNQVRFSRLFNISAQYENDKDFENYCDWKNVILKNPVFYDITSPADRMALVKYDMSLGENPEKVMGSEGYADRRKILNDAINNNQWQSYAKGQSNKEKEEKGSYKQNTNKKPNKQVSDDLKKDLTGRDPDEIKSIFSTWANSVGIKDLSSIDNLTKAYANTLKG